MCVCVRACVRARVCKPFLKSNPQNKCIYKYFKKHTDTSITQISKELGPSILPC